MGGWFNRKVTGRPVTAEHSVPAGKETVATYELRSVDYMSADLKS